MNTHKFTANTDGEIVLKAIPQILVILMLLLALVPGNPYGYYMLLRWVCCGVFAYLAFQAFQGNRQGWVWVLGITAGIYNPFIPVDLGQEIWAVVNVATVGIMVGSIFVVSQLRATCRTSNKVALNTPDDTLHLKTDSAKETHVRPWTRFWARLFDIWMFGLFFGAVLAVCAPLSLKTIVFASEIWLGMACLFVWVFVEALLLSTIGTTPGKWLFKIKLTSADGTTFSFPKALARSIAVWWRGLGTGFPLVSLFTLLHAHGRLTQCEVTSWDREEGFKVTHERIGIARGFIAVVFFVSCLLFSSWPRSSANSDLTFEEVAHQLNEDKQAVIAVSSIQDRVAQVNEASMRNERLPNVSSTAPKAHGEIGEVQRFVTELLDQISAIQNDYSLELEAIAVVSLLDPLHMQKDRTLTESRFIVQRSKAIIDKYEKKSIALAKESIMDIQVPTISEADKKEMLAGFIEKAKRQWQLEREVVQQFESILQILSTTDWDVEDGQFIFARNDDRERIHSHITVIQRIAQQQEASRKSAFAEANREFELLKGTLGK